MKRALRVLIVSILVLAAVSTAIKTARLHSDIEQEILIDLYIDGVAQEQGTIIIDGEITDWVFINEWRYNGVFCISNLPLTCGDVENVAVQIKGEKDFPKRISYYYYGDFKFLDLNGQIIINEAMNEMAFGLNDGRVAATSKAMYDAYAAQNMKSNE